MKRLLLIGVAAVLLGSCGNRVAQAKATETKTSETTDNLYAAPDSDEVLCSTNFKEITLNVIAADLKTRRLLVCSNPKDWCWEKPGEETEKPADIDPDESEDEYDFVEEKYPFVDLRGWIDEEWVCGSTMTTCP